MKTRWKSSQSPLYVKVIWRKGLRHVVLFEEEHAQRAAAKATPPVARSPCQAAVEVDYTADLQRCLTRLRLENPNASQLERAIAESRQRSGRSASCEPSFAMLAADAGGAAERPHSVSVCRPDGSHCFVNDADQAESEGCSPEAFTKRILRWLSTSSVAECVEHGQLGAGGDESVVDAERRPRTSQAGGYCPKVASPEDGQYPRNAFDGGGNECHSGRPQLHIFVPIFSAET